MTYQCVYILNGCPAGMKWRRTLQATHSHINVKVRCGKRTYDACTYLMTKETRAARKGETLSGVVQEHLLDGRAVARHRGRIQGQEHKRLVAGLPGVGPNQGERR